MLYLTRTYQKDIRREVELLNIHNTKSLECSLVPVWSTGIPGVCGGFVMRYVQGEVANMGKC